MSAALVGVEHLADCSDTMNDQRAIEIGAKAFLTKPLDLELLATTVRRLLDVRTQV